MAGTRTERDAVPAPTTMLSRLWQRAKDWLARRVRPEPAPGRYVPGAKFPWRGWVGVAPLVWPRRAYLLYVPRGFSRRARAPLLVLCHGCRQTPEEIAEATRIAAVADREGFLVLLPRQKPEANPWACWNWFDRRTANGAGEAAIVAAQIRRVARRYRVDRRRVCVAGMSAGGALAAILGVRHRALVRAVAVHSGVACGAARSVVTALGVMKRGPEADVERIAAASLADADDAAPAPLLAIQGEADPVVAPSNAVALVRQYLRLHDHPAVLRSMIAAAALPPADAETRETGADGRAVTTREWRTGSRLCVRFVSVAGLAHAWSGGDDRFPFNDRLPPDATALVAAFAREATT
jgi:poly(hydroxyalkanoate) depolymerase family esterase